MSDQQLTIEFDGASRGNPGPAAYGVVLADQDGVVDELNQRLGEKTNNQAEYEALIAGLERACELDGDYPSVEVRGDSQLIIRQMTGEYSCNAERLQPLFQTAQSLVEQLPPVTFEHIPRSENSLTDALANEALDR